MTVNGITQAILTGNYYGQILGYNNGFNSEQSHRAFRVDYSTIFTRCYVK